MSPIAVLALVLVLLPIPLSYLIPASPRARPDLRRVTRARRAVIGFAVAVALIQGAYLVGRHSLDGGRSTGEAWAADAGIFAWAFMSWFFLAVLAMELRRPIPFPAASRRAASLAPRHRLSRAEERAWPIAGAAWLLGAGTILALAPEPGQSFVVLVVGAGALLAFGPWIVRRGALDAEPLPPEASDRLVEAYARRRRFRVAAGTVVVAAGVLDQTALAAAVGWGVDLGRIVSTQWTVAAVLAVSAIAFLLRERALAREIGRARSRAETELSSPGRGG